MSDYTEFFLKSRASIVQLDCLEISHPNFTQIYYCVRNATDGITVIHEDDLEVTYQYVPMRASLSGPREDLDQILNVVLGDLGEIVPREIDAVRQASAMGIKPTVIYRAYASNVLDTVLYGPLVLEIKTFNFSREGATFDAKAPSLNVSKTGEAYGIPRFPMLRGLIQ